MKKKVIIISAILLLLAVGVYAFWKPILYSLGGLKQPELETVQSISNYAKENKVRYNVLATPTDTVAFNRLNKNLGMPGVIFFNSAHLPLKSSKGTGCPKEAHRFINSMTATHKVDSSQLSITDYKDYLPMLEVIDGDKKALADSNYDYIIVYTWAKYLPKQSLAMAKVGTEAAAMKDKNILVISVNLDFTDNWYTEETAPEFF